METGKKGDQKIKETFSKSQGESGTLKLRDHLPEKNIHSFRHCQDGGGGRAQINLKNEKVNQIGGNPVVQIDFETFLF